MKTFTSKVVALSMKLAGTVADREVLPFTAVVRVLPLNLTAVVGTNPVPFRFSVKPAAAAAGVIDEARIGFTNGTGFAVTLMVVDMDAGV